MSEHPATQFLYTSDKLVIGPTYQRREVSFAKRFKTFSLPSFLGQIVADLVMTVKYPGRTINRLPTTIHTTPMPLMKPKLKNTITWLQKKIKGNKVVVAPRPTMGTR